MTGAAGPRLAVLADNLTGAHGSAAKLREGGRRVDVVWAPDQLEDVRGDVVVDMRSRDRAVRPADLARCWSERVAAAGHDDVELRVDTTLRGQTREELEGVLATAPPDTMVVAVPAHPGAGRTTLGGVQHVRDADGSYAIEDTAERLFGSAATATVPIDVVAAGTEAMLARLRGLRDGGVRRLLVDASHPAHLRTAAGATAVLRRDGPVLTVSSGAWLAYRDVDPAAASVPAGVVVGVVASPTPANRAQLDAVHGCADVVVLPLPPDASLDVDAALRRIDDLTTAVVIDTIGTSAQHPDGSWGVRAARGAAELAEALERTGRRCSGFVATGGDAAAALVECLGARRLRPEREVQPLCPQGRLVGGRWDDRSLVTKGGVLGVPTTYLALLHAAHEAGCTPSPSATKENP